MNKLLNINPVGLGLRREMLDEFVQGVPTEVGFMEVAPENWMTLGGKFQRQFRQLTEQHDFLCHGLSLSIGSVDPLDINFLKELKKFFDLHNIKAYSEHLSYCSFQGHMYDLMPIPFTEEAVKHVVTRVKQVQDILERPLILENVSYYAAPGQEMSEIAFTLEVLNQADCSLLLDINNIYVNSVNHRYDANAFLEQLPTERIAYAHIAGHYNEAEDLIVDTHGSDVIDEVWSLLEHAYKVHGHFPTLLERDFNIPSTSELINELKKIQLIQEKTMQNNKQSA
ncbi:DUF692 domain-containing protein [Catenovulum sp. SM1970]|uniref:HvfB family MNIO-type RiPP peptide maturase n=1 Tax=Marinifaba aquimaris TaxID=2741323 RepID=UPI001574436D|nr:DUF692 domain-containing protein [Marinifaba aquimaris]NTS75261.1 DUF692 domain-containing protein [Marinifaba aquimaris]